MERLPLSAVMITLNAARVLEPCLRSLDFVDEILVVDSGSQDETLALARRYGARVLQKPWLGFGPQKQYAVSQAAHPWVLCIDSDERISPPLRAAIIDEMGSQPAHWAYQMPRRNRFLGRWLGHGEGYPDPNVRLFHRDHARWSQKAVHEHVECASPIGRLRGDLMHESEDGVEAYLTKQNRYTTLQAQELAEHGRRAGWGRIFFSPLARFMKFYFFRLGFLDGLPGLVHICIGCFNSFSKYAKLRELNEAARVQEPKRQPD